MNIDKILERINYNGPLDVSPEVLQALQHAFLFSVPFENLDIHANRKIVLEPQRFYEKIVLNRRGGFCYECNTLFHDLLQALGFEVSILAARMMTHETPSPRYSHMVLRVRLDRDYLVDVGNGQSVRDIMPIPGDGISHAAEAISYRVGPWQNHEFGLFYRTADNDWRPRFVFSMTPHKLSDFIDMCEYHQTSPESLFTKQRLCTLPTEQGRITLAGDSLTLLEAGTEQKTGVDSPEALQEILQKYFNIELHISDLS